MDGPNPSPLSNHGKPLFVGDYRGQRFLGAGICPSTVLLESPFLRLGILISALRREMGMVRDPVFHETPKEVTIPGASS